MLHYTVTKIHIWEKQVLATTGIPILIATLIASLQTSCDKYSFEMP